MIYTAGVAAPERPAQPQWKSTGPFKNQLDQLYSEFENTHPQNEQGQLAKEAGEYALGQADESNSEGDGATANGYLELAKGFLDIAIGLVPVLGFARDTYEAVTGKNLLTGEMLSPFQRLVAMAGERLHVGNFREVSGVCIHPEFQGKGLARALMSQVMRRQIDSGQTPFLHVLSTNESAVRLYEKLGFRDCRTFAVRVVERR